MWPATRTSPRPCAKPLAAPRRRHWPSRRRRPGHLPIGTKALGADSTLLYAAPSQTNLDRNTVDMDRERASFADNTVKYEATLRFISANVRTTLSAITGQ